MGVCRSADIFFLKKETILTLCVRPQLFGHVSTAYCHLNEPVLEERPYPPPADPHNIIKCMEWMSDEVAESMTKK